MLTDRRELPFRVAVTSCVTDPNKLPQMIRVNHPGKLYRERKRGEAEQQEDATAALAPVSNGNMTVFGRALITASFPARRDFTCFSFVPPPPDGMWKSRYVGGSYLTFPAS